jgi:regulator of sirC expression with transglutaminase-like and TPR domain
MDLVQRFAGLVQRPEPSIPLDEAALVIAACAQPEVSVDAELERLDLLAAEVGERSVDGVVHLLFGAMGFTGNRLDYYDPRNSYLNCVIDRRLGIPITLSVLLIEVGRRVDVPFVGVGMPGHFLVRDARDPERFVDPFASGAQLSRTGCMQLFRSLHGPLAAFHDAYLAPVGRDLILKRMLANLRNVYVERDDTRSLALVLELATAFADAGANEHRELASALGATGAFDRAAVALERAALLAERSGDDPSGDIAQAFAFRARCN